MVAFIILGLGFLVIGLFLGLGCICSLFRNDRLFVTGFMAGRSLIGIEIATGIVSGIATGIVLILNDLIVIEFVMAVSFTPKKTIYH